MALLVFFGTYCNEKEIPQKIKLGGKHETSVKNEDKDYLVFAVSGSENPQNIYRKYNPLAEHLSKRLGIKVKLVQKRSYLEFNKLFKAGKIDFGRLATGGFVKLKEDVDVEILALVTKDGNPRYQASIIVHNDSPIKHFDELRGKTFAFVDRLSNSGFRYPCYLVLKRKSDINTFFSKTLFTGGHDNSIKAVFKKDVDGASVSSTSISRELEANPKLKGKIRIILQSPSFTRGPFVIKKGAPAELKGRLKKIIFSMHLDNEGREVLRAMKIDGFVESSDSDFDFAQKMLEIENNFIGKVRKKNAEIKDDRH
jgi:phosphonate transport system substrate-binding protein